MEHGEILLGHKILITTFCFTKSAKIPNLVLHYTRLSCTMGHYVEKPRGYHGERSP